MITFLRLLKAWSIWLLVGLAFRAGAAVGDSAAAIATRPAKSLRTLLDPILTQAKTRTVRILMGGTSIATFQNASNQLFVRQLMALYGSARADVQRMGVLGGSWYLPVSGWNKQPYCGPSLVRIRGDSASQPLAITGYGSKITVEYSREADGGGCQVMIDGVAAGTFDCSGTQHYSLLVSFPVPLGPHTVTFSPPAEGHVYLERVVFEQGRPGIAVIDGTLGGTSLANLYTLYPSGGGQVPGVPAQTGVGVASFFGRPDIDLVIWSGPVNDAYDVQTWETRMNDMVESTRGRCPLILIAEMGGHWSAPADPGYSRFQAQHDYLLQLGRDNDHVYTVDWHGATLDSDIQRYAATYYPSAVFDPQTGLYATGDFIHPNTAGQRVALGMLCSSLAISNPVEDSYLQLQNRIYRTSPLPPGTPVPFLDGSTPRSVVTTAAGASVFAKLNYADTLPLIFSAETENVSTINAQILASPTSEKYGKYLNCPQPVLLSVFGAVAVGEKVTVTALVKSGQPYGLMGFWTTTPTAFFYHGEIALGNWSGTFTFSQTEPPIWITFEYEYGGDPKLAFQGRLFSLSVTRTHGQPVATYLPQLTQPGTCQTLASSNRTPIAATLHAIANPQWAGAMGVSFAYGTDPDLAGANQTLSTIVADGGDDAPASMEVRDLLPGTTYYYRAQATVSGNPEPVLGEILSFQILPNAQNPIGIAPLANGHIFVAMFGVPGGSYTLEASVDLNTWVPLATMNAGSTGVFTYEDPNDGSLPARFYRMRNAGPSAPSVPAPAPAAAAVQPPVTVHSTQRRRQPR